MKKFLLPLMVLLTVASHGQPADPVKTEKIKALFALMHQDSLIIKTIDGMTTAMIKNMSKIFTDTAYSNLGIDVSKMTQKFMEKSMKKSKENTLRLLNEDMVGIYDSYFTVEEIDDFSKFYKSKSGQKLINKTPDITKDVMAVMATKYGADFQQFLMKDMEEMRNEMTEQMKKQ